MVVTRLQVPHLLSKRLNCLFFKETKYLSHLYPASWGQELILPRTSEVRDETLMDFYLKTYGLLFETTSWFDIHRFLF